MGVYECRLSSGHVCHHSVSTVTADLGFEVRIYPVSFANHSGARWRTDEPRHARGDLAEVESWDAVEASCSDLGLILFAVSFDAFKYI